MRSIAVIIPVKNDPRIFPALDKLIVISTLENDIEIVVVDNGSSVDNYDSLKRYCENEEKVTLLREYEEGSYVARNTGISFVLKNLGSEILAFIDADCVVDDGWLSSISEAFDDDVVSAIAGKSLGVNKNDIALYEQMLYEETVAGFLNEPHLKRIDTRNFAARDYVFEKAGLFLPVKYGGDMEFGARIHRLGMVSIYVSDMVVYHENPTNLSALLEKRVRQNYGNHELHSYCEESYLISYLPHLYRYFPSGYAHKIFLYARLLLLQVDRRVEYRVADEICLAISKLSPRLGYIYFKVLISRACRIGDISYSLSARYE